MEEGSLLFCRRIHSVRTFSGIFRKKRKNSLFKISLKIRRHGENTCFECKNIATQAIFENDSGDRRIGFHPLKSGTSLPLGGSQTLEPRNMGIFENSGNFKGLRAKTRSKLVCPRENVISPQSCSRRDHFSQLLLIQSEEILFIVTNFNDICLYCKLISKARFSK